MNAIVNNGHPSNSLYVPEATKDLIQGSLAENTLKAYQRALAKLTDWLKSQTLSDALLATYITELHRDGKSPATIAQAVAAVKWQLKHQSTQQMNLPITQATLSGIRRDGRDRGRGQVDGLIWQDVERVCLLAELENSLAGLRDSAMIRLMSDCLLRISEVVAIDIEDFSEKTLTVRASKTDQEGAGETLYVTEKTRQILKQYTEQAGIRIGTVFRRIRCGGHIQPNRLNPHSVRRIIKSELMMPAWRVLSPDIPSE